MLRIFNLYLTHTRSSLIWSNNLSKQTFNPFLLKSFWISTRILQTNAFRLNITKLELLSSWMTYLTWHARHLYDKSYRRTSVFECTRDNCGFFCFQDWIQKYFFIILIIKTWLFTQLSMIKWCAIRE